MSSQDIQQTSAPLTAITVIQAKISQLQLALQQQLPGYEALLHTIHVSLISDDELVHLLKDEEIGTICLALAKKKNVVIAEISSSKAKNTTAGGKKLSQVSLDDL